MKNNLGKILIICIFFISGLFANVKLTLNTPAIYAGEMASFTITSDGDDINFPTINSIDSYNILGSSSSSSTTIINGNYSKKISKTYSFSPTKDVIIPSFEIIVDGKTYKTQEQKISVIKPSASKEGEDFVLELRADKEEVKIGESINLSVIFKYKLDSKIDKLQLSEPILNNFWIKKVDDVEKTSEKDYIVFKQKYLLFPQKSGEYDLSSLEADIGKVVNERISNDILDDPFFKNSFFKDSFFNSMTNRLSWQKVYSNVLHISVKPLPNNLELFGDYSITTSVDKTEVDANQPVNLSISITGKGNIDDIQKYNITIENVISYADEPKIESTFQTDEYGGNFTQKIAFVAQNDYTIPKIELTYFNKNTNEVKTIYSEPINIKVINNNPNKSAVKIETANETPKVSQKSQDQDIKDTKENKNLNYIVLALALLVVILTSILLFKKKKEKKEVEKDIVKAIKKAKNDKELFELLLPYSKKSEIITDVLNKLEENLYKNTKNKIDKNELMNFFEDEIV
ncbi:BatD family protein [Arcobacter sp. s6]|uniref:BatD family protein n=1 Tax=Arcobacter sp. s6 TaxID=3230363 RepID=UPI00349FEDC3